MIGGLYTAQTAMFMFETALSNYANNLANVNTTAFKRSFVDFQDVHYTGPDNLQIGYGGKASAIATRDFAQGPAQVTDGKLDLYIGGLGFFPVTLANGETAYTRDGTFRLDATGTIVDANGNILQPGIVVPPDARNLTISSTGVVSALTSASPDAPVVLGQITLTRFINTPGLRAIGENLLQATSNSGPPIVGTPGSPSFGIVRQGVLEASNVEIADELTRLIAAQRAYEINSRTFQVSSQILDSAFEIIR